MATRTPEKIRFLREVLGVELEADAAGDAPPGGAPGAPQFNFGADDPATRRAVAKTVAAAGDADGWITTYLTGNNLRSDFNGDGSGSNVLFANKTTPVATVIDTTVAAGKLANLPSGDDARALITSKRVARAVTDMLLAAQPHVPGADPARKGGGGGGVPSVSMQLGYTFTPETTHTTAAGVESKDQPAHQIAGTLNVAFHADDADGFEIAATAAITIFADEKGKPDIPQSAFAGVQLAWVKSFLEGALTAGPLLTAVAGASRAQQTLSGKLEWVPTGQVGIGGQVQYAIPGFNGHVLIGAQAGISGTVAKGAEGTLDRSAALTFTYKF